MFYKEDDIDDSLNCPRCKERFDKPIIIVPCFETLCFKCVQELSISDQIECFFCNENHQIPKAGFKSNTAIEKLLKAQPKQVHRNNNLIKELEEKLTKLTSINDEFSMKVNGLESELDDHCTLMRNQIDLVSDEKIEEINQIRHQFLKQVDDYKVSCLKSIENNKNRFNEIQKESAEFIENCNNCLKEFEIDNTVVSELSLKTDWKLSLVELEKIHFEYVTFNVKKTIFERSNRKILHQSIGKFTDDEFINLNSKFNYRAVSASRDRTLKVWDVFKSKCIQTLTGHTNSVFALGVLSENTIISGSADNTLKIWNLMHRSCLKTLEGHTDAVYCLSVIDSNTVASGSYDKTIKIWNLENLEKAYCVKTLEEHNDCISFLCKIDKTKIVSGSRDKTLKVWDLIEGKCKTTLNEHTRVVHCVSKIDNSKIVSGSFDKTLKIWNIETGKCLETLKGHKDFIYSVLSIDKNTIVSGSKDKTIKIWTLDEKGKGTCKKTIYGHTGDINCLSLIGKITLLSGSDDKTIKVWNIETGTCIRTLIGHEEFVYNLSILN